MKVVCGLVGQPVELQKEIALIWIRPHLRQVDIDDSVLVHVDTGGLPMIEKSIAVGIQMIGPVDNLGAAIGGNLERDAVIAAPHGAEIAGFILRGVGYL